MKPSNNLNPRDKKSKCFEQLKEERERDRGQWWEGCRGRVKGRESRSDGETESATQKEVSFECIDTAKLEMLAKA